MPTRTNHGLGAVIGAALAATLFGLAGCADETYASVETRTKPYILKEGCTFSIIAENGSSSISSPEVAGTPVGTVTLSISFGDYEITVSNCTLVGNSHGLPVYED